MEKINVCGLGVADPWADFHSTVERTVHDLRRAVIAGNLVSHRRDYHFDDTPFLSRLKHLIKVEGVQQNDSLADGQACSGWIASGGSRRMRGLAWQ